MKRARNGGRDGIRRRTLRIGGGCFRSGGARWIALASVVLGGALFGAPPARAESALVSEHADFFKLLRDDRTDIRFHAMYEPEVDADDGDGAVKVGTLGGDGEVAYPLGPHLFLRLGAEFDYRHLKFKRVQGAETELASDSLYLVATTVGAGYFFSKDLLLSGSARPGAFSDFDRGFEEDDYRLDGELTLAYRFNPGAAAIIGAEYSERYDDTPLLPLLGFRLISEDGKITLNVLFPAEARLAYNFNPRVQVYLRASREGEQFRMDSGRFDIDYDLYVARQWFGFGTELWLSEHFAIRTEAGISAGSEMEMKRPFPGQFKGDLETGSYLTLQLGAAL